MKSYCVEIKVWKRYWKHKSKNFKNGRTMVLSKCAICDSKNSRFIKNQEAKGVLSNLGIKATLSKVPILGDILFEICMLNSINEWNS